MSMLLPFFHLVQGGLGAWGLGESYKAITNLQQYEDMSEKAAQYSRAASQQLHKTRTTQASGAIAICISVASSVTMLATNQSTTTALAVNALNIGVTCAAQLHISKFWSDKSKVPTVKGFNDAIEQSNTIKIVLTYLGMSWAVTTLTTLVVGFV